MSSRDAADAAAAAATRRAATVRAAADIFRFGALASGLYLAFLAADSVGALVPDLYLAFSAVDSAFQRSPIAFSRSAFRRDFGSNGRVTRQNSRYAVLAAALLRAGAGVGGAVLLGGAGLCGARPCGAGLYGARPCGAGPCGAGPCGADDSPNGPIVADGTPPATGRVEGAAASCDGTEGVPVRVRGTCCITSCSLDAILDGGPGGSEPADMLTLDKLTVALTFSCDSGKERSDNGARALWWVIICSSN